MQKLQDLIPEQMLDTHKKVHQPAARFTQIDDAIDALKSFGSVVCCRSKQNRGNGAFLPDGSRAPNRGVTRKVCTTLAEIVAFFQEDAKPNQE